MQRIFSFLFALLSLTSSLMSQDLNLKLMRTYGIWQQSMLKKDFRAWDAIMASERKREIRNRIYSEKKAYPSAVFEAPVVPPSLKQLKLLQADAEGDYAKAVFFGKVDFGVGGAPTDNLLVVKYQNQADYWRFLGAEYVNLSVLPEVRSEILAGDYQYLDHAEYRAEVYQPKNTIKLDVPVAMIAKVYAYCPGREVKASVNRVSNHLFQNTQEAEVVIGGARAGLNELKFSTKALPGAEGGEPFCVRVYLFSQVQGVKPIKVAEYLVQEGGTVAPAKTIQYTVTNAMMDQLVGK